MTLTDLPGVSTFIDDFVCVRSEDHVLVLYTPECREQAARLVLSAQTRSANATALGMRPLVDDDLEARLTPVLVRRCNLYENAEIVGEFGIGSNEGITSFIPMNSHINERHPGVHFGFGQHGQSGRWSTTGARCTSTS